MTINKPEITDRELLEMAAKAAGLIIVSEDDDLNIRVMGPYDVKEIDSTGEDWNPLFDDGDALRLAVKLDMIIDIDTGECATSVDYTTLLGDFVLREGHRFDPYAATRRAIVRAAAEMGRDKP